MPYIDKICEAGEILERFLYHTYKYPNIKEGTRGEKIKPLTDSQRKTNLRQSENKLRWLLNANFKDGDFLVRLDFQYKPKIEPEEMGTCLSKTLREIKRKAKQPLTYVYTKEVGPRGSRHVHIVMNKIDTDVIMKAWKYGGVHIDPLYSHGQYKDIASYFMKYAEKTEDTLGKKIGKKYQPSRNMIQPKITKRVVSAKTFRHIPHERKGFFLEKDSFIDGVNSEGYEYCFASYTRSTENEGNKDLHAVKREEPEVKPRLRNLHHRSGHIKGTSHINKRARHREKRHKRS